MMNNHNIPFLDLRPQYERLKDQIRSNCDRVYQHCQFVLGPEVSKFEKELAEFCGVEHCIAVSSGTEALHLILLAEGIGPGDGVFLPDFTYTATAEVPLSLGATPVFVDVDPRTFQIDPNSLRQRIARIKERGKLRPRVIIGVDLFGQAAPWKTLKKIAKEEELFLVSDCAQSLGGTYCAKMLGSQAQATALSFYPTKPLGAYGDSGAILTNDAGRDKIYRSLRSHGQGNQRYDVQRIGLNGRMDTLQAAILLAKLPSFKRDLARRRDIAAMYDQALQDVVMIPKRVPYSESSWSVYSILLRDQQQRDAMRSCLTKAGIGNAVYYPQPLHTQPAYNFCHDGQDLPISQNLAQCIMALPLYPDLSSRDVGRIIDVVKNQITGV